MKSKLSPILLILVLCGSLPLAEEKDMTPHLEPVQSLQPAQENAGKTPVLEEEKPMENLSLEIKEKKRLKKSPKEDKKITDSNGKIHLMTEIKSPQRNKESQKVKQGKLTREQMDFREKDKTEYAF